LHKLKNGKLVHDVVEEEPISLNVVPKEEVKVAGVESIEKADALLAKDAIEFIEISKEDAEVLSKVEKGNFKLLTDGSRFILKWNPYLPLPPEE